MVNATPAPGALLTDAEKAAARAAFHCAVTLRRSMTLTGRFAPAALEAALFKHLDQPAAVTGCPLGNVAILAIDHLAPRYVEPQPPAALLGPREVFGAVFSSVFLLPEIREAASHG